MNLVFILNLQPDLSGNPFLRKLMVLLNGNRLQKRLGAEGGNSCPNSNHYKVNSKLLLNGLCRGDFPNWKRRLSRRHFR
jgi:hypothetical protein